MAVDDTPHVYNTTNPITNAKKRYTIDSKLFKHGTKKVKVLYDVIEGEDERDEQFNWIRYNHSHVILQFFYKQDLFLNIVDYGSISCDLDKFLAKQKEFVKKRARIYKKLCDFQKSGDLLVWAFDYLRKIEDIQAEYEGLLRGSSFKSLQTDLKVLKNAKDYFRRFKKDELKDLEKQIRSLEKIVKLKNRLEYFPPKDSLQIIEHKFSKYLHLPFQEKDASGIGSTIFNELYTVYRIVFK